MKSPMLVMARLPIVALGDGVVGAGSGDVAGAVTPDGRDSSEACRVGCCASCADDVSAGGGECLVDDAFLHGVEFSSAEFRVELAQGWCLPRRVAC